MVARLTRLTPHGTMGSPKNERYAPAQVNLQLEFKRAQAQRIHDDRN